METTLILASASPRRLALLEQIGIKPERIIPADIPEIIDKKEKPIDYVKRMSLQKAICVAKDHKQAIILAADTIVIQAGKIIDKAHDDAEVEYSLKRLSGKAHQVITSICVISEVLSKPVIQSVTTKVIFKQLTPAETHRYVASKEGIGKAGGYAIQGQAACFVKRIHGSYTNIVGLPLYETHQLLISAGYKR